MLKRNVFGQPVIVKRWLVRVFGSMFYRKFRWKNSTDIQGAEIFQDLPDSNVLLVSNHQTYFADVTLMVYSIQSSLIGRPNEIKLKGFLKCPKANFYFIAAEETMKSGFLPKVYARAGAITVKRTWRAKGKEINREVDSNDTTNIAMALSDGWVISFPQGTTTPFAPGRKGTAHIIKEHKPIVIPIVINGFRRAFDKKGLFTKKKGTTLSLWIKPPLKINYEDNVETIMKQVIEGIEQSQEYNLVEKDLPILDRDSLQKQKSPSS
ncbi:MAG: 1-acyl-sn-glycerol-3-phosphate acyltransferase [Flavobacteriales bacterium]|nr:1-acyl-sn-glycerol-3-phosphate acyltransferase [Flavobacteriales bacterium]